MSSSALSQPSSSTEIIPPSAANSDFSDYLFHLWTSKTPPIKNLAELLKDLLTEGNLECNSDGIKLLSTDSGASVLVHLKLYGDKFEAYSCQSPFIMGLSMDSFFKIIKNMENNDTLRLFINKNDTNFLGIERFNKEENIYNTIYLNLLDIRVDDKMIPPAKFDSVIVMSSSRFHKICREINNFSKHIDITCSDNQLIFKGTNPTYKQEIRIRASSQGMKFEESTDGIVQGVFNLQYLVQFSKCVNLCPNIRILLKNDFPLVVQCDVANLGNIKLCLSPIVPTDD
jgi:proliferating cell nuclear antigen